MIKIKLDKRNTNLHTDAGLQLLEKSIDKVGIIESYTISNDGVVISGNARHEKISAKITKEPIVIETDGTEAIIIKRTDIESNTKKFHEASILANTTAHKNFNPDNDLIEEIAVEYDIDIVEMGVEVVEEDPEPLEATEDDFDATPPTEPITVLGDLYEIGEHRLLCGDSTDSDQVAKLMDGSKADMAHNDPPYGMKKEKEGVLNDNLNYSDLLNFNKEWIALQFMHLKENGSWYCWGIDEPIMDIYSEILKPYIAEQKATFRNLITWDKGNGQGQNSENTRSYAIADEKCLFAMLGVQGFNNNQDNYFDKWETIRIYLEQEIKKLNESDGKIATALGYKDGRTVNHWWSKSQWSMPTESNYYALREYAKTKNIDAFKKEYEEIKKEYYSTRAYFNNTHDNFNNVWKFERHLRNGMEGGHATPKPIPLCERAIKSSCPDNGLVLDMFLGSGSTMVASHQLKRKCYGMELDPKYCDVIVKRMIKLDPTLIIKRNGVVTKDFE
jgi:DNA modification methylase